MSEYAHIKGKLIPIPLVDGSVELTAKALLEKHGYSTEKEDDEDSYENMLIDEEYRHYIFSHGQIFELVDEIKKDPYEDVYEASRNPDGSFDFVVKYYNGGCSLDEAITEALKPFYTADK